MTKDGKAIYERDWGKISDIGKKHGFKWGGDWFNFKDEPHFEMDFGKSIKDLKEAGENNEL